MLSRYYRYFRWLSLDVVLGANLFMAFLGRLYQVSYSLPIYLALSTAIWLIYTCDHLVDAFIGEQLSARRAFHHKHFHLLLFVSGVVLVFGLINIAFLPVEVIRAGSLLGAGCIAYLMLVFFFKAIWFKEALVAIGYSIGVFLSPIVLKGEILWIDYLLVFQLGLLALCNLLIFSHFERWEDQNSGFGSMVIRLSDQAPLVIKALLILVLITSSYFSFVLPAGYLTSQIIYFLMAIILLVISSFHYYFSTEERFRVVGDGIFYLPVIFLF